MSPLATTALLLFTGAITPGPNNLLVLRAVASEFDTHTDLDQKLADRAQDYDALPAEFRDAILDAYQRIDQ